MPVFGYSDIHKRGNRMAVRRRHAKYIVSPIRKRKRVGGNVPASIAYLCCFFGPFQLLVLRYNLVFYGKAVFYLFLKRLKTRLRFGSTTLRSAPFYKRCVEKKKKNKKNLQRYDS